MSSADIAESRISYRAPYIIIGYIISCLCFGHSYLTIPLLAEAIYHGSWFSFYNHIGQALFTIPIFLFPELAAAAAPAFIICNVIAYKKNIQSIWYYTLFGALSPTITLIFIFTIFDLDNLIHSAGAAQSAASRILIFTKGFLPAGALGGFVYWLIAGRHIYRKTA